MVKMEVGPPQPLAFIVSLFVILLLDMIWFSLMYKVYDIQDEVKIQYGLLAWGALALALSTSRASTDAEAAAFGAMVGFVTYAVFNGTELALRKSYRRHWYVPVLDLLWGTTACTFASFLRFRFVK